MFGYCKKIKYIYIWYLIYRVLENIEISETQKNVPNIELNPDEVQVYMVSVMMPLARHYMTSWRERCSQLFAAREKIKIVRLKKRVVEVEKVERSRLSSLEAMHFYKHSIELQGTSVKKVSIIVQRRQFQK